MADGNETKSSDVTNANSGQEEGPLTNLVQPELLEKLSDTDIVKYVVGVIRQRPNISINELIELCGSRGYALSKSYGYNLKSVVRRAYGRPVDNKYHNTGMREFIHQYPSDMSPKELVRLAEEQGIRTSHSTYQMVAGMQRERRREEDAERLRAEGSRRLAQAGGTAPQASAPGAPPSQLDDVRAWEEMMPKPVSEPVEFDRDEPEPAPRMRTRVAPPLPPPPPPGPSIRDNVYERGENGHIKYPGGYVPTERRGKRGPIAAGDKPVVYGKIELRKLMMRVGIHAAREVLEELEAEVE